ncbi:MAG: glycosyltransferase [Chitinophagaceae bacterium]|nr:glycosyltransferase [Chitinophagaceae bacterium]
MHIFHMSSWFPSRHGPFSGISTKTMIHNLADIYPGMHNSVSLYHDTSYRMLLKKAQFLKEGISFLRGPSKVTEKKIQANLSYIEAPRSGVFSSRLGFNQAAFATSNHRKNLEFVINNCGKPDILHAQVTYTAGTAARQLAKEFNIPYIITERIGPFPWKQYLDNGKLIADLQLPLEEACKVVAVSRQHAHEINKYVNREIVVINNMVNEDVFFPLLSTTPNNQFTFATITSSFNPNKGIQVLLDAIKILKDKGVNASYIIGGGELDSYYEELKNKATLSGIDEDITWHTRLSRKEVVKILQQCDSFVLPSFIESFGQVYVEALACGKPAIGTLCGGPESIITDDNGLLVPVNDAAKLAEAMEFMIHNRNKYVVETIRQDVLNRFSKKGIAKKYYNLYKEIIENKNLCAV